VILMQQIGVGPVLKPSIFFSLDQSPWLTQVVKNAMAGVKFTVSSATETIILQQMCGIALLFSLFSFGLFGSTLNKLLFHGHFVSANSSEN
jgi:hypothetical protein